MSDAIKLAIDALEAACGGRCNAEYNPCRYREALAALRAQPDMGNPITAQPDHSEQHLEMVAAARAVVERWDTPLWKDAPATAGFINRLRDALPPAIGETME